MLAIPGVKYVYPYLPGRSGRAIIIAADDDRVVNGVTLLRSGAAWSGSSSGASAWPLLGAGITMNRDIT